MTTYSQILKRAFRASWSDKTIWLFGLLAAFLGVGGAISKSLGLTGGQSVIFSFIRTLISVDFFSLQTAKNIFSAFSQSPLSVIITIIIFLILLIISIILLVLALTSQAAVVNSIAKKDTGKKVSYMQGLSLGLNKFWSLFGLNLISKIAVAITFFFLLNIAITQSGTMAILAGIIYSLLIVITAIVLMIVRYAICHLVIENANFLDSLKRAKEIFLKNWLTTFEVAFILFVLEIFIVLLIRVFTTIDAFILYIVLVGVSMLKLTAISKLVVFLIFITISIIAILSISFFTVFSWAVWVILFNEIEQNNILSKIKGWLKIR